jgi:plasmid segregation protein ParM
VVYVNVAGIDPGRHKVKTCHEGGRFDFYSNLGECREFEFGDEVGKGQDDIIGEYKSFKFTAGTLARRESEFGDSFMVESKLHQDTVILILIALHKIFDSGVTKLVTGLPIKDHGKDKQSLKEMLNGYHKITVNGVTKEFDIQCEVAAEGSGIYKYAGLGVVRGLNIGSRTVNAITFNDGIKIGRESDTFDFGMESVKTKDHSAMARAIASKTGSLKWKREDKLFLIGGGATDLYFELLKYYPNARVPLHPIYTDAEAFLKIAREIYGR